MIKVINKEVEQLVKIPAVQLDLDRESAKVLMCIMGDTTAESVKRSVRDSCVKDSEELCLFVDDSGINNNLYNALYYAINGGAHPD